MSNHPITPAAQLSADSEIRRATTTEMRYNVLQAKALNSCHGAYLTVKIIFNAIGSTPSRNAINIYHVLKSGEPALKRNSILLLSSMRMQKRLPSQYFPLTLRFRSCLSPSVPAPEVKILPATLLCRTGKRGTPNYFSCTARTWYRRKTTKLARLV